MEVLTWRDVVKNANIPTALRNWFLAVYGADSVTAKHWRKTNQFGRWERAFKTTPLYQQRLHQPIQRAHLKPGELIPVSADAFTEYDYFPTMCNIIAKCSWIPLGDLSRIAQFIPCVELMSEYASAISLRIGKVMCRLFTSGVMVLATCETIEQAKFETHQFRMLFERIPVPILVYDEDRPQAMPTLRLDTLEHFSMLNDFQIVNMVANAVASPNNLDLMQIISDFRKIGTALWDPESFPGAKLKIVPGICPVDRTVTVGLFDTGRNMLMGFNRRDLKEAQKFIRNWVKPYVDQNLPMNPINRFKYRIMKLLSSHTNVTVPIEEDEAEPLLPGTETKQTSSKKMLLDTQQNILDILDTLPNRRSQLAETLLLPSLPTLPKQGEIQVQPLTFQTSHDLIQDQFEEDNIQEYLNDLLNSETVKFLGSIK